MIRLGISAEGATEREFINRVLRPHLIQYNVTATAIDMRGNVSLDKIRGVLPALLGSCDRVSTLYDFYGFKGREQRTAEQLEAAISGLISPDQQRRLIPYIQLYEFETLLFAVPEQTVEWMQAEQTALKAMQEAVQRAGSAERVNDRLETSPSHRIKVLFSDYDKKLHGPEIVELAGLAAIRAKCPRFNKWIEKLEQLA
ncbi:DUF4276 family protein [Duganella sp.]|uniref:DUF4276 family protein n=1 Tax=Duganella sp. TaxID=1904440 RepID=UPI0031D6FD72